MDFVSENTSPVHPAIVEAVARANTGYATNFEQEAWSARALDRLKEVFERDLVALPVVTGTAANAVALSALVPPYGAVLCHWDAHIETDECGAPELFTAGARQIGLPGAHGKLDPDALRTHLDRARFGVVHAVQPSAVSLTQLTEAGTAYSLDELAALSEIAKSRGLKIHVDGARFANALVARRATPAEMSWKAGIDVLCLGTTKTGTFGVEVMIAFDPDIGRVLSYMRKRGGHFVPKSRFLAAQIEAYLTDDLWLKNAAHANSVAKALANRLAACPGVKIVHPVDGNEVFATMPDALADFLFEKGFRFTRDWRLEPRHHRFVASWASSFDDVEALVSACSAFTGKSADRPDTHDLRSEA